jgi:hypothetical protein
VRKAILIFAPPELWRKKKDASTNSHVHLLDELSPHPEDLPNYQGLPHTGEERKRPIATNAPISPQRFDSAVRQATGRYFIFWGRGSDA